MMSLFSSFDLYFFKTATLCYILFFLMVSFSFWPSSYKSNATLSISSFTKSFLKSIMSFKFKMLDLFVFSFMIFLAVLNFSSILPFNFSLTSQISFNLFWGFGFWGGLTIFSFFYNIKHNFIHFVPEGTPFLLIWFLFMVELVSNIIRPMTLVVRLLANILAGHLLMILLSKIVFIFNISLFLYFVLNLVEIFVSFIQAYIFVTMISLYFSELS